MTTAHKNLTGVNLHEPKGADTATANKVYVTNGSGSGTWQKITSSQLDATAGGNSFGGAYLHAVDSKAAGSNGGTFTSGAWRTRTLGSLLQNQISGASLAANRISLPYGTYFVIARAPAYWVAAHQCKLVNVTDAADLAIGSTEITRGDGAPQTNSAIYYYFGIAGTKNVELQHRCSTTRATDGFGVAGSFGTEIYSQVLIWKLT